LLLLARRHIATAMGSLRAACRGSRSGKYRGNHENIPSLKCGEPGRIEIHTSPYRRDSKYPTRPDVHRTQECMYRNENK